MSKNLEHYLNWATLEFTKAKLYFGHGTDNPWDEAVHVAIYALTLPKDNPRSVLKLKPTSAQITLFEQIVTKRIKTRAPLPYLTGYCWYAHQKFLVSKDTLIPRSPIFELLLANLAPWLRAAPSQILDMCTGGGCLAILAAQQFPQAQVTAVDISLAALELAAKNIELHQVSNVLLVHSDLFTNLQNCKFDTIISNPPYVSENEMRALPREYMHEPKLALESLDNGLAIPKMIIEQACSYLSEDGILVLEVGNTCHALEKLDSEIANFAVEMAVGGHGIYVFPRNDLRMINERIKRSL